MLYQANLNTVESQKLWNDSGLKPLLYSYCYFLDDDFVNNFALLKSKNDSCVKPKYDFGFILDSNLHKNLNKIGLKQNCMVEGDYKKARLFIFETENLYFLINTETGDTGSNLYFTVKDQKDLNKIGRLTNPSCLDIDDSYIKEISQFLKKYIYTMIPTNEEYIGEMNASESNKALLEILSNEFGLNVGQVSPLKKKSKMK